jgi:pimeloyl-ACP methyl ester carboxylesterase
VGAPSATRLRAGHRRAGRAVRRRRVAVVADQRSHRQRGDRLSAEVDGNLKELTANPDFESLLALDGAEVTEQSMAMHETYDVSAAALDDYMTSYAGSRFGESARFVRNYPTDLALLEALLPQIQTPVKIINSDHDPMVPLSNAEYLNERLPRCELTVLDAGHFAWEDKADAYGDAALAWLEGGFARVGGDA